MSAFALMTMAANASTGMVISTSCGKQVMTVGPECFENFDDLISYMEEVNEVECGEKGNVSMTVR